MNNATMPDQLAKGVPNVFPLTSARSMYEPLHHLKFGLASSYYDQMRAGVKISSSSSTTRRSARCRRTPIRPRRDGGRQEQLAAMDLKLVAETLHKPTDTDFSASVARLKEAKCDLILVGDITRDTVQIVSAVRKTVERRDAGAGRELRRGGGRGAGRRDGRVLSMTPVLYVAATDSSPAVDEIRREYKKQFGKEPNFAAQSMQSLEGNSR